MRIKSIHLKGGISSMAGKLSYESDKYKIEHNKEWGGFTINNTWVPEHMVIEIRLEGEPIPLPKIVHKKIQGS